MSRVFHPRQQGARLSWGDSLFQQVDRVLPPAPLEPVPLPDVHEVTKCDYLKSLHEQDLVDALRPSEPTDV